uniref:Uncharacterized protein n=1 Tax=Strongyloides venezuelensis TaxID=75913 RepID=A0A0K0FJ53_STRVS
MKVFITLTHFLIVVIFKTFVNNAKEVTVNVFVKPKCLCSDNEYVFTNLNTSEWQPDYKNLLCGYYFDMCQVPLTVSKIPETTLSFNHSCTWGDREDLYIYNVTRDCKKNSTSNSLKQFPNGKYVFFCEESNMKIRKPESEYSEEEE